MKKILILMFMLPLVAGDLYVHPERGRKGGTKESPYKYLADALAAAQPGDTLHLSAGQYHGKGGSGHWEISQDGLTLLGGYNDDFSARNPFENITLLAFDNSPENKTKRFGGPDFKAIERADRKPIKGLVLDGLTFDGGNRNTYREDPQNPSMKLDSTPGDFLLHLKIAGGSKAVIRNCTFLNPGKSAAVMAQGEPDSELLCSNNVFVNGVYHHMIVGRLSSKSPNRMKVQVENNSFLFSWQVSANGEGVVVYPFTDISFKNNVFAFGDSSAIVNDRYEEMIDNRGTKTKGVNKTVRIDDNQFFMWKRGLYGWVEAGQSGTLRTSKPDDLWETSLADGSGEGNLIADPGYQFNRDWIELYAQRSDIAEGDVTMDAVNQWRSALGLNLKGNNNPNRQSYAMRYPLADVMAFRKHPKGKGATLTFAP
ncbi:MAG: hypothetical protein H6510_08855 [Acidobacteria bacterium]|nr:hypothetical protein [Acidobacteriota bacterium]MCB9397912.1 hypothetical protein [Acidobacteriota bacterium]